MRSRDLLELIKPPQTLLLLVTSYCAYLAAGGRSPLDLAVLTVAEALAISGTTAANMYLERDIDALMPRTSRRPLPSGSVPPGAAVALAAASFLASLAVSSLWSRGLTLTILVGFLSDVLIYTEIVKRVTPYNVILGGIAGAMPALGGWALARGLTPAGLLLAAIVLAWIPMHIWFIATYYADDYRLAGIPMMPVVRGPSEAARYTEYSTLAIPALAWAYWAAARRGIVAALVASALAALAVRRAEEFRRSPTRDAARAMFKLASPMIAVVFVLEAIEGILGIP
ncbi:MAG: heme o synthase [Conexivisphaera sp.]